MNRESIKISVIIPCFNAEAHLEEALYSIVKQTYKNIEIICIDDGSVDSTWDILNKFKNNYDKIKLFRNPENQKLIKTLNRAINLATGEYIARMDADDISHLDRLEIQLKYIISNKLDVCGTLAELVNESGRSYGKLHQICRSPRAIEACSLFGSPLVHPSILIKKEILKNYFYRDDDSCYVAEDYDLWCRLIRNNIKIGIVPKVLLKYRISKQSESLTKKKIMLNNHLNISMKQQIFFLGKPLDRYLNNILICNDIEYIRSVNVGVFIKIDKELSLIKKRFLNTASHEEIKEIRTFLYEKKILFYLLLLKSHKVHIFLYSLLRICCVIPKIRVNIVHLGFNKLARFFY